MFIGGFIAPLINIPLTFAAGFYAYFNKALAARAFLLGNSIMFATILIKILGALGFMDQNTFTHHAVFFGACGQLACFSIALATRIKTLEARNVDLQQQSESELKQAIEEVSQELERKNYKINENIEHAHTIQKFMIPTDSDLVGFCNGYQAVWQPLARVGGDIIWLHKEQDNLLIGIIDCTGHGVSGAFVAHTVSSILNLAVAQIGINSPAKVTQRLNQELQKIVAHKQRSFIDFGCELAL